MNQSEHEDSVSFAGAGAGVPVHRFARDALGTTCEVIIAGRQADYARRAADAAFEELAVLEGELSRFVSHSDVARINALSPGGAVKVGPAAWECLQLARRMWEETDGAFDVTLGTGMGLLEFNAAEHSVGLSLAASVSERLDVPGSRVTVDLGGIGKGYAVDRMVAVLRDWKIDSALVHTGQSSVYAIGAPSGEEAWSVAIRDPADPGGSLGTVPLRGRALSGSGVLRHGTHIIDPRTGRPATGRAGAWCAAHALRESATTSVLLMEWSASIS